MTVCNRGQWTLQWNLFAQYALDGQFCVINVCPSSVSGSTHAAGLEPNLLVPSSVKTVLRTLPYITLTLNLWPQSNPPREGSLPSENRWERIQPPASTPEGKTAATVSCSTVGQTWAWISFSEKKCCSSYKLCNIEQCVCFMCVSTRVYTHTHTCFYNLQCWREDPLLVLTGWVSSTFTGVHLMGKVLSTLWIKRSTPPR